MTEPKVSFSKLMDIAVAVSAAVSVVICITLTLLGYEPGQLYDVALALITAFTVCDAVYKWKERTANKAKYAQQFVMQFADKYGIDAAIQIAEVVLRE